MSSPTSAARASRLPWAPAAAEELCDNLPICSHVSERLNGCNSIKVNYSGGKHGQ